MEYGNTQTASRQINHASNAEFDGDIEFISERLDLLLETNAEIARGKSTFIFEREKLEASLMKNPLTVDKTFARLGLLLGAFPPASLFTRFFIDSRIFQSEDVWILGVAAIVTLISTVVGYFSGKFIGNIVFELEKMSWSKMLTALPFVGIFWGIMAGGAGGIIIFGIGAFFGAVVGGLVGGAALPFFSIFHRLLKRADKIESKHFLPLAFGITFIISAFFLGL
jgi:hypothetical protein